MGVLSRKRSGAAFSPKPASRLDLIAAIGGQPIWRRYWRTYHPRQDVLLRIDSGQSTARAEILWIGDHTDGCGPCDSFQRAAAPGFTGRRGADACKPPIH